MSKEYIKTGSVEIRNGKVYYHFGCTENGCCFKDEEAYEKDWGAICYIPEYAADDFDCEFADCGGDEEVTGYTHNQLLELCYGNRKLCDDLFYSLDWCYPETKLDEWESHGTLEYEEFWDFVKVGAKVFWNDPADETSGEYEVVEIRNVEGEPWDTDTIILISDGYSEAEVPLIELTPIYEQNNNIQ